MKRYLLSGLALLLVALPVRAEDDEHTPEERLDFARKLRERGYVDLALEYFEAMAQRPPAALESKLRFELAKTRLMLARNLDPEERLVVIEQSRTEMQEFENKYRGTPEAAIVAQDLKRLTGQQAQAILSLSMRLRGEAQQEKAQQAEKYFLQNAAEIEASIKSLANEDQRQQARFDLAVNKMEQARCYVNTADEKTRVKRAGIVGQARKMFDDLARQNGRIGLLSQAWLIKCCSEEEGDDPLISNKNYDKLKILMTKEAEEARRLARYFQMVRIPRIQAGNLTLPEKYKKVQTEAEAWLSDKVNLGHIRTPTGYGVRYELANALFNQALLTKDTKRQDKLYADAQQILYSLNEPDNDLIGKVSELRSKIARVHLSGGKAVSIAQLATFDQCQIRAAIELDRALNVDRQIADAREVAAKKRDELKEIQDAARDPAVRNQVERKLKDAEKAMQDADKKIADLDKKFRDNLRPVVQALSRALALADKRTPRYAIDNVRNDLLIAYANLENKYRTATPYRTAIFGESLGMVNPPNKISPLALELSIDAYARIAGADPSEANRRRLRGVALFALSPERVKLWEKENVVGLARYQLALLDQNEATLLFAEAERNKGNPELLDLARAKLQDAVKNLNQLPKETPNDRTKFFFAQGKAVFLALEARDKVGLPKEKEFYRELARKMIADLPPLPDGIDGTAAYQYFHAKMEESKFLYEDAARLFNQKKVPEAMQKYQEMAGFLERMAKELAAPTIKLEEDRRDKLKYYIGTMEKYAAYGQADVEYRAGHYDKVLEPGLTGKVVDFVKKEAEKDPIVRLKDFQLTGQIVGLALRANVQLGKIDEAARLMRILKNIKDLKRKREKPSDNPEDDENSLVDPSAILRGLVSELDTQINDFRRKGDQQQKLAETQKNFTQFLDALVQPGSKLDRKDLFFLARCYDTLDQHEKAAKLYAEYPKPAAIDVAKKEKDKFSEEEERELQAYCYAQVMLAKQLRLSKKTAEAKDKLDAILAHRNPRQLLQVEREQIYLLEDAGLFGTAITRWSNFMNSPTFKGNDLATDSEKKKIYFDAYFHLSYSWYKYSQTEKVKAAGKDGQFLIKAVDYIVRLENAQGEGWQQIGHRFRELLQSDRALMEAYTKQGGGKMVN